MPLKKLYDEIGTKDGVFNVSDARGFKYSSGMLICSIINLRKENQEKELCEFCENFEKENNLTEDEIESLYKDSQNFKKNLEKHIDIIKKQLANREHEKLEFMHTLNRFIIEDDCDIDDYRVFETIKNRLFS